MLRKARLLVDLRGNVYHHRLIQFAKGMMKLPNLMTETLTFQLPGLLALCLEQYGTKTPDHLNCGWG